MDGDAAALFTAIEARSKELVSRGAAFEAEGVLPDDVLVWMIRHKLFKLFVPKSLGGAELTLQEAVRVYEALAAIDGSLGWLSQIGSGGGFFVPSFEPEVARRFFEDPRAVIAGTGHPAGRARRVPGGYVVSGRWKYASGAQYATLFTANAVLEEGARTGARRRDIEGDDTRREAVDLGDAERIRAFAFLPHEVRLIRDWEALGMQATSSWTFVAEEVFVPEERSFVVGEMIWDPGYSVYRLPFGLFAVASIASVCVGLARAFFAAAPDTAPARETTGASAAEALYAAQQEAERYRMIFFAAVERLEAAHADGTLDEATGENLGWMMRHAAYALRGLVLTSLPLLGMRAIRPSERVNRIVRDLLTAFQHVVMRPA
ncbi:MAG: acyl-CoA dehydrogenase [Hydrogenibacillus sp.]|nr:acyl-CoA dehydrogenase [Hydrogenibacillus sp.]